MTETAAPLGAEAQPSAVANDTSIDTGAQIRALESDVSKPEETEIPGDEKPKELSPAEELEKLRRAKVRDDRRIGKLTAQKYQYQKEADELRSRLSTPPIPQTGSNLSPAKTGIPTKLDANNFDSWADYSEARAEEIADYKFEQKFSERDGKQKQEQQSLEEKQWIEERQEIVAEKSAAFEKENPGYFDLVKENWDILQDWVTNHPELDRALLAADNPQLAFVNLAKEGKLEHLAQMSLVDAKVEIRLAQLKQPEKPKTKAPTPLPAARGSVPSGKDPAQMTDDEFNKWRRASMKKR